MAFNIKMTKYKRKNKYIQHKKMGFEESKIGKRQINKNTNSSTFFLFLFWIYPFILYFFLQLFLSITNAHSKEFLIISSSTPLFCPPLLCDNGRSASIDKMKIKKEWKFKKQIKKVFFPPFSFYFSIVSLFLYYFAF